MNMSQIELNNILELHRKWTMNEAGGIRADLSNADLSYANLSSADLSYANLSYADLHYASLRYANLRSVNLSYANLSSADLRHANLVRANLSSIKEDFFKRLAIARAEVIGLYDAVIRGKIEGSSYSGECSCFVGTIAKIRNEKYDSLGINLEPEADSATERWFMGISKGDTPHNSSVSKITSEWLEEFMAIESLVIPRYQLISSIEMPELFEESKVTK